MKIPPKRISMNHQAWKPGSCHSCLVWLEDWAAGTQPGAWGHDLTLNSVRVGRSPRGSFYFLFLKIYIYLAWGWDM